MAKKTNLQQIAESAGVSLSTVDRVLNGRGGVSQKKETLVLEWANKLGLDRVSFRSFIKTIKVAVLLEPTKNPFFRSLKEGFEQLANSVPHANFQCFFHYVDVENSSLVAEKIPGIVTRYDALIVIAPDDPVLADALASASKSIPVICMVTDIPSSNRIACVGPDNRQMGRTAGELIGRFLGPEGGNVVVILGLHRFVGHEQREMGFRAVIRERFPNVNITHSLESSEDQKVAGRLVHRALRDDPSIRGIYNLSAGNSEITADIERQGLADRIVLITHELTPERRLLLRQGRIDAIIDQNPHLEIQRAYELLAHYMDDAKSGSAPSHVTHFNIFISESC